MQYEDLINDYDAAVHKIIAHAGLPWIDSVLDREEVQNHKTDAEIVNPEVRGPLYAKSMSRWRSDLTSEEQAVVERKAGFLLRQLGYTK